MEETLLRNRLERAYKIFHENDGYVFMSRKRWYSDQRRKRRAYADIGVINLALDIIAGADLLNYDLCDKVLVIVPPSRENVMSGLSAKSQGSYEERLSVCEYLIKEHLPISKKKLLELLGMKVFHTRPVVMKQIIILSNTIK